MSNQKDIRAAKEAIVFVRRLAKTAESPAGWNRRLHPKLVEALRDSLEVFAAFMEAGHFLEGVNSVLRDLSYIDSASQSDSNSVIRDNPTYGDVYELALPVTDIVEMRIGEIGNDTPSSLRISRKHVTIRLANNTANYDEPPP